MRGLSGILIMALATLMLGCNGSGSSVAGGWPARTRTEVGPVPGPPTALKQIANPLGTDPVALQDGRRLFDWYNCSGCHGGRGGGGMGPSLRDNVWLYGDRDDQIFDSIAEGRSKGMPAWGDRIPSRQIWELVAYIKSMRTPQEPDAPTEPANEEVTNPVNGSLISASEPGPPSTSTGNRSKH